MAFAALDVVQDDPDKLAGGNVKLYGHLAVFERLSGEECNPLDVAWGHLKEKAGLTDFAILNAVEATRFPVIWEFDTPPSD